MNREELIGFLFDTEEFSKEELESMSNYELFNVYCNLWNTCKKLQNKE